MNYFFFAFSALSLCISVLLVPVLRKVALKYNIIDHPSDRKIHDAAVPYLGGLAIYAAFISVLCVYFIFFQPMTGEQFTAYMIGSGIIVLLGLVDDIRGTNAWIKFTFQILAALVLIFFNVGFQRLTNPFESGDAFLPLGWLGVPMTILWVVGLCNAINLLDGLDGLASGVVIIAAFFFMIIFLIRGDIHLAAMMLMLATATGGFLFYNFPPAKIFMGDTGAMFLGFTMAFFGMVGERKSPMAMTLLVPIVLLFVPIIDTVMAFIRRTLTQSNPFAADKEHLHHRLLNMGIGYRRVLVIIYLFCMYLGGLAIVSTFLSVNWQFIVLVLAALGLGAGLYILNLFEKGKTNGKKRPHDPGTS